MSRERSRASAAAWHAITFGWHYFRRTELEHFAKAGTFLRRIWALGLADRLILFGVLCLAGLTGLAALPVLPPAWRHPLLGVAHLGFFVVAWSVALAAAAATGRAVSLVVLAPWLTFYLVLACSGAIGTPAPALPLLWLLVVMFVLVTRIRAWWLWLLIWSLISVGAGYTGSGPTGLRRALGWNVLDAQLLAGGVIWALGIAGGWFLRRRRPQADISFSTSLTVAAVCLAIALTTGAWRDWNTTIDWTRLVFDDASAIVVLFWLWTAGSFAASALQLMGWSVRRVGRAIPTRLGSILGPAVIAAVTLRETLSIGRGPIDQLALEAMLGHITVGVIALAMAAWWWMRGTQSRARTIVLFTWWLVTWAILSGIHSGSLAVVATRDGSARTAGIGLFIVAVGLAFELGQMEKDWMSVSAERARGQLGLVALAIACAVVLSTVPGPGFWESSRTLMVLAGMLHLGVPLAMAKAFKRHLKKRTGISTGARIALFASGYATALAILIVEPVHATTLLAALPVLAAALWLLSRAHPEISAQAAALGGALFGGGLVAGWMMPYPPTVPFMRPPGWVSLLRNWGSLGRPPLSMMHVALLAAAWIIGALAGWAVIRAKTTSSSA